MGSLIGPVFNGGVSDVVGGALGINAREANQPIRDYNPTSFSTSGLSANVTGTNADITRSALLNQTLAGLGSSFNRQFSELGTIRGQLQPGFGQLTQAAVAGLENRRRSAIGNLRENLQRRRVLGSSFGADALARTEAEFAQQESEIRAAAKLQEIQANIDLINQQAQAQAQEFNVQLSQLNLEAEIAARISTGVSGIMGENARAMSDNISGAQTATAGAVLDLGGFASGFAGGA